MFCNAVQKFKSFSKTKKAGIIVAFLLTIAIIITIPVYAWFSNQRKLGALVTVDAPFSLYLSAANRESLTNLDLSEIDVEEEGVTHKDYIFCVIGSWDISRYKIQLAHTTNIPFKYYIYKIDSNDIIADEMPSQSADVVSVPYKTTEDHTNSGGYTIGTQLYYTYRRNIVYGTTSGTESESYSFGLVADDVTIENGKYKYAKNATGDYIASTSDGYYDKTYDETDNVQKRAVPIYIQSDVIEAQNSQTKEDFCHYYVVRVDWSGTENISNSKETDVVYLTATTNYN